MESRNVILIGGSGLVGQELAKQLEIAQFTPIILTRKIQKESRFQQYTYNSESNTYPIELMCSAFAIIFLQGASIAEKSWTKTHKKAIVESRTRPIQQVYALLAAHENSVEHIISASAIGIYGNRQDATLEEETQIHTHSSSFLVQSVIEWEKAIQSYSGPARLSIIRIGLVISKLGGIVATLSKPIRWHLNPYFFPGNAWYSWIHIIDLSRMFIFLLEQQQGGILNGVAPNAIRSLRFQKAIARSLHKWVIPLPAPKIFAKLMLGERSELILQSARVYPSKFVELGFKYRFNDLQSALVYENSIPIQPYS